MKKEHRYLSWGLLVFSFVIVFFHRLAIGSVSELLTRDLNLDSIQIANIAAMTFYGYALMQLPVGIMVDTIGVRKLCTAGMVLTAIGSILFGLTTTTYLAYGSRLLVGIGTSVIIVSVMKIQATLFPAKMYSTLSGLTSLFGNFGAFFATIPLTFLAYELGWRQTFIVLGILTAIVAVLIYLFVYEQPSHKREKIKVKEGVLHVIKNKRNYPDFFIMVFFVGSLTAILGLWGTDYLKHVYSIKQEQSAYYLSFVTYGFMIGAPIIGRLADKVKMGIKGILAIASGGYVLIWLYVIVMSKGQPPLFIWPILFFFIGLCIIAHILVFSNVKEINPLKYTGIAISIVNMGEFIGSGLISLLMGYIIKQLIITGLPLSEIFRIVMWIILGSAILSFISVMFMHSEKNGG